MLIGTGLFSSEEAGDRTSHHSGPSCWAGRVQRGTFSPLSGLRGSRACGQALGEGPESRCDEQMQRVLSVNTGPHLSRGGEKVWMPRRAGVSRV